MKSEKHQFESRGIIIAISIAILFFVIGILVGFVYQENKYNEYIDSFKPRRFNDSRFSYIAPLVGIESNRADEVGRLNSLQSDINHYISSNKKLVSEYSYYFRNLNTAEWIGENENTGFIPASLLKITLALSIKKEEENRKLLDTQRFIYTSDIEAQQHIAKYIAPTLLKVGNSYTTDELVEKMIIDSDNGAKDLLYTHVDKTTYDQLYDILGVQIPEDGAYRLSAKDYSFFFRLLYSSTYLTMVESERLLNVFTKVTFKDGLVKYLPSNTIVAHKFGSYVKPNKEGDKPNDMQLHDCGIIYYPDRPYVLCVMTRGKNQKDLSEFIAGLSKVVYDSAEKGFGEY